MLDPDDTAVLSNACTRLLDSEEDIGVDGAG